MAAFLRNKIIESSFIKTPSDWSAKVILFIELHRRPIWAAICFSFRDALLVENKFHWLLVNHDYVPMEPEMLGGRERAAQNPTKTSS
ncbi:hypothetical protein KQX54_013633 [Cotesia glomerata]|uniref:Uncharacterized protein n=1 Tax=Cotesia glomerata TaxID=32391 RepID=A0AAV7IQG5_COTGL|nr:hypothetical protein KQX54_013633 [Cotesia glomerata]